MSSKYLLITLLLLAPSFAFEKSDFYLDTSIGNNGVIADWGHGCQYYVVSGKSFVSDTITTAPSIETAGKSMVKNGNWEVLNIGVEHEKDVWEPNLKCTGETSLCDEADVAYGLCNTTKETHVLNNCTDLGKFIKEKYTSDDWVKMDATQKFKAKKDTKIRYCADYDMKKLDTGWGVSVDIIPTFVGYSYPEYQWFNASWAYRVPCYVNTTVAESLTDFPAHCIIDTQALIAAGKMNSSCKDLRAVNSSDNLLPYEIENSTCNTTTTVVHLGIPATNATGNDTIYIYYGNPTVADAQNLTGLWKNYVEVYHFASNVTITNSVGDTWGMAKSGTSAMTLESTPLGFGVNDTNDATYLTNATAFSGIANGNSSYTLSLFVKVGTYAQSGYLRVWEMGAGGTNNQVIYIDYYGGSAGWFVDNWNAGTYNTPAPTIGNWYYVTTSYNKTHRRLLVNGTMNTTAYSSFSYVSLAGATKMGSGTQGVYTEARLSNQSFSDNYLIAEQKQTSSIGAEESAPAGTPILNFVSPTPLNGVNNFTYGMVFNFSSDTNMTGNGYIEIDGSNKTCTLAGNLSCSYTLPYGEHLFNNSYDLKPWANLSGTYYTNTTLYNFSYYGCGIINSSATMLGHANRTGGNCFIINGTAPIAFNGAGFLISGNDTHPSYGIHINYTNATITNAIISNFSTGIYTQGNTNITNTTISNCLTGGIDIESLTNFSNNTVYNNTGYGIQARATDSIILNNSIYNNTNVNIYVNANGINASDNLIYNSTIGIDARERDNVSLSKNHYHNNTWDLAINGTNYNATSELFDSNGSMANYTNISFSVANTGGTVNFTWATNSSALASGTRSFIGKLINISSGAGTPVLDTITFNWLTTEVGTFTESKFHIYKYNGTWTDLNNTPDTANNQLKLSALSPAGHYAIVEWWNDTLCLNLIDAYGVNQNTSQYLNVSDVWLYIIAENVTLNNTCPIDISVDYKINESTANASWITRLVSFSASELKNVSNYSYRIPMVSSDLGEIGPNPAFFYPNNHHYRFNSTYTSRNVTNLQINISSHGDHRQFFKCEDSVSCNVSADFGSPISYSLSGNRILRSGDTLGMLLEYVVSWENDGGVGPSGTDTSVSPVDIPVPANASETLAIATEGEGIDWEKIKSSPCCIPVAILVLIFIMTRRKR